MDVLKPIETIFERIQGSSKQRTRDIMANVHILDDAGRAFQPIQILSSARIGLVD